MNQSIGSTSAEKADTAQDSWLRAAPETGRTRCTELDMHRRGYVSVALMYSNNSQSCVRQKVPARNT